MNTVVAFYNRQYGYQQRWQYDNVLSRLSAHKHDCWRGIAPSEVHIDYNPTPPIFAAKFANCSNHRNIIAIANEDGKVAIQNTDLPNDNPEEQPLIGNQCHNNAVFDVEWVPGQMQLVSASGDHTTSLWQLRESRFELIRTFNGHSRSVKTVAFRRTDPACFATGGRDNAILIWDTRARPKVGNKMPKADNCIISGHATGPGTPQAYRRRQTRQATPKLPPNTSSSSITGLAFQDDYTLASCGGGDGIIKVWDLRRNYSCYKKEPVPKHSIPYPGTSTYQGYSNLLIDSTGQKLYVNCMDHNIYCFNLGVYATHPVISYTGLTNSTFYIKSSLSPDDQYLISGSKDEKAYIWNVNSSQPILALHGHADEVTCVAWARTNELRIITCSDDSRHKIWRINNDNLDVHNSDNYRGEAQVLPRTTKQMAIKRRLKDLENTPRSLKRIVELNETTPSSTEKCSLKRSFGEMNGGDLQSVSSYGGDSKRQLIETRARRLFAPTSSTSSTESQQQPIRSDDTPRRMPLPGISEEVETPPKEETNKILLSPLNERNQLSHYRLDEIRTPSSSNRPSCSQSLFSPTSNLPNYVMDASDAPHLKLQSPKRKLKENIDWLTKIRKQKLSTTISRQLNEKLNDSTHHDSSTSTSSHNDQQSTHQNEINSGILSPRMRKIKSSDRSSCGIQRRMSTCQSSANDHHYEQISTVVDATTTAAALTTPTRRKSETTLLRYFCVTPTTRSREQSPAAPSRSNDTTISN
ncbi:protein lethal(2)denticleless [Sitodiplosis mosellana]|uniref:protein lethal(2)denticleless n=1 Tax=Sitodiplosis mosellana TaxID=263140 RepID=UPI002444FA01|nr:protein lethal(2)denticleless [Sitodiplosis mosellana]